MRVRCQRNCAIASPLPFSHFLRGSPLSFCRRLSHWSSLQDGASLFFFIHRSSCGWSSRLLHGESSAALIFVAASALWLSSGTYSLNASTHVHMSCAFSIQTYDGISAEYTSFTHQLYGGHDLLKCSIHGTASTQHASC